MCPAAHQEPRSGERASRHCHRALTLDLTVAFTPPTPECWRTTIDGWVRNPAIRRHVLFALVLVLIALVLMVSLARGPAGEAIQTLLPSGSARLIAEGVIGTAGPRAWFYRRIRR
jgi:hypothetical protein